MAKKGMTVFDVEAKDVIDKKALYGDTTRDKFNGDEVIDGEGPKRRKKQGNKVGTVEKLMTADMFDSSDANNEEPQTITKTNPSKLPKL